MTTQGTQVSHEDSLRPVDVSRGGEFVLFGTSAALVSRDTNNDLDVYVHESATGVTKRVSVSNRERQADSYSFVGAISANGRFAVFDSYASNLTRLDHGRQGQVYVRDLLRGRTRMVSVNLRGNGARRGAWGPTISANGRFVAFTSSSRGLVRDDTNQSGDVFVRDLWRDRTMRVSVSSRERQARTSSGQAVISGDGSSIAFEYYGRDLVPSHRYGLMIRDWQAGTTRRVGESSGGSVEFDVSHSGRFVVHAVWNGGCVSGRDECWALVSKDMGTGERQLVSATPTGEMPDGHSGSPSISADGMTIAYESLATDIVTAPPSTRTYLWSRASGGSRAFVVETVDSQPAGWLYGSRLSPDGLFLAAASSAANLVTGDTNNSDDVFLFSRVSQPRDGPPR